MSGTEIPIARIYGEDDGSTSSIGSQFRTHLYWKKALTDLQKEKYFSQLADTIGMPKNMGKNIKRYHYLPLLDDRNVNDQGIDAAGAVIDSTEYTITLPKLAITYAVEADATAAAAAINAVSSGAATKSGSSTPWTVTTTVSTLGPTTKALSAAVLSAVPNSSALQGSGNLYGSSKDIGTIQGKLPALSETGGRVNRVGFTRVDLTGSLDKFGFFQEYTQESMDFDTDAELETHVSREMLFGAHEMTEAALQIDLLEAAGVTRFPGAADDLDALSGETGAVTEVSYGMLSRLDIDLSNNRCPKHSKIITGSRMIDTKVIPAARIMYIGSELQPTLQKMVDYHNNPAFIPLAHYAAAGSEINGEIGSVAGFRIVVVPEMLHHSGKSGEVGVKVVNNAGYRETGGYYDAYPMLVVGSESFTTVGFQTSGKMVKFKIFHKKPGEGMVSTADPYGETGLMSIKWYYGFMPLRTERLAVIWTVAQL